MKKLIQGAIAVLLLATCNLQLATLHAQGTAFTYQGRLNDTNGPANGSYDITFTAYGVATGGSSGGTLTNLAVAVTNGLFTTTLDTGNIPDGSPIWLELAVRTNGSGAFTPLSPRQAVTPAPYAMFANTASNLVGKVTAAQLPASVVTNGASGAMLNGANLNGNFTGNGAGVTNVNAAALNGLSATNFWQLGGNTVQSNVDFIGSVNDAPLDLKVNGNRALRLDSRANVLGGSRYNQMQTGGIYGDTISATVAGGGAYNIPNIASAPFATVSGGAANTASGFGAVVSGGGVNGSNIGANTAGGPASVVAGGYNNQAYASYSAVGGGANNSVSGLYSVIPGGNNNQVLSDSSFAAGNRAKANHYGSFVWADGQDADFATTANNQFLIRALGGLGINTNNPNGAALSVVGNVEVNRAASFHVDASRISMGNTTIASGVASMALGSHTVASGTNSTAMGVNTVASGANANAMGTNTTASGNNSTALGDGSTASGVDSTALGYNTVASGDLSTALGDSTTAVAADSTALGYLTTASGNSSTAMGVGTTASGGFSTAMGVNTTASGNYSTAMGVNTTASGNYSTAMGEGTTASGNYSTAMGYFSQATNSGAFVWADSQEGNFSSTAANQFLIRASGGVGIGTNAPAAALHVHQPDVTAPAGLFVNPNFAGSLAGTAVRGLAASGNRADVHPGNNAFYPAAGEFAGANGVIGAAVTNSSGLGNGVIGTTPNANGSGVYAENRSTNGAALTIGQGALRVAGAGVGTPTTAFTVAMTNGIAIITNAICDGDPNAILIITPRTSLIMNGTTNHASSYWNSEYTGNNYVAVNVAFVVSYGFASDVSGAALDHWSIKQVYGGASGDTYLFNVLVIKP